MQAKGETHRNQPLWRNPLIPSAWVDIVAVADGSFLAFPQYFEVDRPAEFALENGAQDLAVGAQVCVVNFFGLGRLTRSM